jgi:DNA repair protein RecN (Recombination protein N)
MLCELHIRNLAVIDEIAVTFSPGLNVLTGETGAGKSILIDALQLVLGARSSEELMRSGAEETVVEAAFDPDPAPGVRRVLEAEGIPAEAGEVLVLRRHLSRDGKSRAYANGRLTSAATLRILAESLVDIHGQHAGQPLLDPRRHGELLDAYAGTGDELQGYRDRFARWQAIRREAEGLRLAERERAQRLDLLQFQRREIESAVLRPGEEAELDAERARLANHERIFAAVEQAYAGLEEADGAALERLAALAAGLRDVARIDPRLQEALDTLETGTVHLREAARALRDYRETLEFDPQRLDAVEARLHEIGKLKRKYGATAEEVLGHLEQVRGELAALEQSESRLAAIDAERAALEGELTARAERLSGQRRSAARKLQDAVLAELAELGMARAALEVRVAPRPAGEGRLGPSGFDEVEFLISPNPGEALKALHRIASGGELSRIMLALRVILAAADRTPTLVFDEVDAGIGGGMGETVGRKLVAVSRQRQVLCVTHLPQIASFADRHLVVTKRTARDQTRTTVASLEESDRLQEVARMLGGPERSSTPLQHAAELLEAAARLKKQARGAGARGGPHGKSR